MSNRGKVEDLTGKIFGKLTAFSHIGSVKQSQTLRYQPALWLCYCSCGYPVAKTSDQLKKGRAIKCYNCKNREKIYSDDECQLNKVFNGVSTYFDPKSRLFSVKKHCMPCSMAEEVKDQLICDKLPGELKIIEIK